MAIGSAPAPSCGICFSWSNGRTVSPQHRDTSRTEQDLEVELLVVENTTWTVGALTFQKYNVVRKCENSDQQTWTKKSNINMESHRLVRPWSAREMVENWIYGTILHPQTPKKENVDNGNARFVPRTFTPGFCFIPGSVNMSGSERHQSWMIPVKQVGPIVAPKDLDTMFCSRGCWSHRYWSLDLGYNHPRILIPWQTTCLFSAIVVAVSIDSATCCCFKWNLNVPIVALPQSSTSITEHHCIHDRKHNFTIIMSMITIRIKQDIRKIKRA